MFTFNVILGYQGLLFWDFLRFFFFFKFFFFSIRPTEATQYQETHSTLLINEKKGGVASSEKKDARALKDMLAIFTNQNLSITFVKFHLNVIFTSLLFS